MWKEKSYFLLKRYWQCLSNKWKTGTTKNNPANLALMGAVSFLWRATEQKDLADSRTKISFNLYPSASKKL